MKCHNKNHKMASYFFQIVFKNNVLIVIFNTHWHQSFRVVWSITVVKSYVKNWDLTDLIFLVIKSAQLLIFAWKELFSESVCLIWMHFFMSHGWRVSVRCKQGSKQNQEMQEMTWKVLFASSLVLLSKTCLCEVRKTIKVEKLGTPHIPAHLRLEAGDQKEVTVCLKFRTFAYKDGFHCPFAIYTGIIIWLVSTSSWHLFSD